MNIKNEDKTNNIGIGFVELLQIVFIVLKLCKVINWKWIFVLMPLWLSTIIYLIVVVIALIIVYLKNKI